MELCDKQKAILFAIVMTATGLFAYLNELIDLQGLVTTILGGGVLAIIVYLLLKRQDVDEEKIAKEIARLDTIEKRREVLENLLKTHYNQLVKEVYEKWFDKPTPSRDMGVRWDMGVITEYSISLAKIIYREDEKIIIKELEEPLHQNKIIVKEAIKHLKCYSEAWSLWSQAKKQVNKQNLKDVEKLWRDLIKSLTDRFSTCCPQLVEWHGGGAEPDDYYNLRRTFDELWYCVQYNRELNEVIVTQHDDYFLVKGFARSLNKTTMEAVTEAIKELATDSAVQKKMKTITTQKTRIAQNIEKFRESLELLTDDVKRKDKRLGGNCSTCKHWLEELTTLEK